TPHTFQHPNTILIGDGGFILNPYPCDVLLSVAEWRWMGIQKQGKNFLESACLQEDYFQ
ncbi:hypothetical protein TNIN_42561, partial [Trichonephila inaurata madagascariensis]